jgi:hypothetical protein
MRIYPDLCLNELDNLIAIECSIGPVVDVCNF